MLYDRPIVNQIGCLGIIALVIGGIVLYAVNSNPEEEEAFEDYEDCNQYWASGDECTKQEFINYLLDDVANDMGDSENTFLYEELVGEAMNKVEVVFSEKD